MNDKKTAKQFYIDFIELGFDHSEAMERVRAAIKQHNPDTTPPVAGGSRPDMHCYASVTAQVQNKAEFIKAHLHLEPREILRIAGERGFNISPTYISNIRSIERRAGSNVWSSGGPENSKFAFIAKHAALPTPALLKTARASGVELTTKYIAQVKYMLRSTGTNVPREKGGPRRSGMTKRILAEHKKYPTLKVKELAARLDTSYQRVYQALYNHGKLPVKR